MKTLSKKKKVIILSVMIALLLVTGYVNVALNSSLSNTISTPTSTTTANFYTSYRNERETTRTQEIQFYDSIIASATSSESAKVEAEQNKDESIFEYLNSFSSLFFATELAIFFTLFFHFYLKSILNKYNSVRIFQIYEFIWNNI